MHFRYFFVIVLEIGRHQASYVSLDSACCVSAYLSCLIFSAVSTFSIFEGLCHVEGSCRGRDRQGFGRYGGNSLLFVKAEGR